MDKFSVSEMDKYEIKSKRWFRFLVISFILSYTFFRMRVDVVAFIFLSLTLVCFIYWKINDNKYQKLNNEYLRIMFDKLFEQMNEDFQRNKRIFDEYMKSSSTSDLSKSYKIFKLKETSPFEVIKNRYKELAQIWHPDKWVTSTVENQKIAERNFKKLQNAYDIIKKSRGIK